MFSFLNPYMLWIKIGAVVVLGLVIGGLYWYGQHEAGLVVARDQQIGQQQQVIADDKANIQALESANQKWADAFKKYQQDAQNQSDARQSAEAQKDRINAELRDIEKLLRSNPSAAAQRYNAAVGELVCLLNRATGGPANCPAATPAAAPRSAAP